MKVLLLIAEGVSFVAALVFGLLWCFDIHGRWEALSAFFALLTGGAELVRRRSKKSALDRFPSDGARIQHREKLRKEFREELYNCRAKKLRQDVIVRRVDRVDDYPNIDNKRPGISPWFRVAFLDMYERGIVLCLSIGGLKECDGGYRFVDYANDEKSDVTAWLMADVPFDSIEAVNMEGDKYYYFPHIYCYFDFGGEPYEKKWFAEKIDQDHGHPYFKKIADYDEVVRNNPKEGALYFG
ncbi:MAG: hypothetical protein KF804_05305 [Burkholderiales bacterium]|nr:hypothetical protein [Burkholderiales bacterium]